MPLSARLRLVDGLSVALTTLHGVADASVGRAFVSRRQTRLAAAEGGGRAERRRTRAKSAEVAPCASRNSAILAKTTSPALCRSRARRWFRIGSSPLRRRRWKCIRLAAVGADETLRLHSDTQFLFVLWTVFDIVRRAVAE